MSTVTGRISQVSQARSRLCTLKAEGRAKAGAFGRVWTCWFLETKGRVGPKNPGRLRRERKKKKSPMFIVTCSFDKIWDLLGPLGFWLSMGERHLLGLQIWHDCG